MIYSGDIEQMLGILEKTQTLRKKVFLCCSGRRSQILVSQVAQSII